MESVDVAYLSIAEAGALFRSKRLSPVELTQTYLARIERLDPLIQSFLLVTGDEAIAQAKVAEAELSKGIDRGPLHGIPIGLKDLFATKGIRTTAQSRALIEWVPDEDAAVVSRLKEAGTVLLGKLALQEFAMPNISSDSPFPPARNPWNPDYRPGGSSSGSGAAVAGGLCMAALGSDTGASIRSPASQCGIVGLKPTYGRVSCDGVIPLSWSLDHVGPLGRNVRDCALMLQAMAGFDPHDYGSANQPVDDYLGMLDSGVRGLRVGVTRHWFSEGEGVDGEVMKAFEAAIQTLKDSGIEIADVQAPFDDARRASGVIFGADALAYHKKTLETAPELLGDNVLPRLRDAEGFNATDYIEAQRLKGSVVSQMRELLTTVDGLVMPTVATPPALFEGYDPQSRASRPQFTSLFNVSGLPAISVPCGFTQDGLPIGLQIAGQLFNEAMVLRIAQAYEQATPWHTQRPPLFDRD
ncbi:MAG: amidase [SAR202 cluster bacterium]|nr:amidase [SAR202 cluster bacterium]